MLMTQNRNKLLSHFIGHAVTTIVHRILSEAANKSYLREKYSKEVLNAIVIARTYCDKINPAIPFSETEASAVREEIVRRVNTDLQQRIRAGYAGIDLSRVELEVDTFLKEMAIT